MALRNHDLSNRTVLITGASSGLGDHFSRLLASAGASIVMGARRIDRLQNLQKEITNQGSKALAVEMDVTDPASITKAYDQAEEIFGPVHSVIANAGINAEGMAIDLTASEFDQIFAVNTRGVFLTAQEGAKRMIKAGSRESEFGRITIISSITANGIFPGLAAYSASKAAVLHMGKVMAREWARDGISVNMICPGYIETEINSDWFATELGQKQISKWPRRRLVEKSDLDSLILLLTSDAARRITGSVFTVDDGQSL